MKQLVVDDPLQPGEPLELTGAPFHHLCRVRRAVVGERVTALSTIDGGSYRVRLESIDRDRCLLFVEERLSDSRTSGIEAPVSVYMAPLKGKRTDGAVRQLTELGVGRIGLVNTARTVATVDPEHWMRRVARLETIVREAVEQCGRSTIPELVPPVTVDKLPPMGILFHESSYAHSSLEEAVERIGTAGGVSIATGPEGGFSPSEVDALIDRGWTAVTLPFPVLRAETAVIAATTLVVYTLKHYSTTVQEQSGE